MLLLGAALCAPAAFGGGPVVPDNGVKSAAALAAGGPISPGSLISIFGTSLAASTATADSVPLSTSLSDASVTINGVAAPLSYASPGQINAQVPWEVQPGSAAIVVSRPDGVSPTVTVQVAPSSPGIFSFRGFDGRNFAVAQNSDDFTLAWPSNAMPGLTTVPVKRGQGLILYATGLGAVDPTPATGDMAGAQLSNAVTMPTVTVGGVAAQVQFAGMSPGYVGVNQLNIVVPADAPTGSNVALQIATADGTSSDQVVIAVQ
jgi:uncharacterized protein (TIGR03437 family)